MRPLLEELGEKLGLTLKDSSLTLTHKIDETTIDKVIDKIDEIKNEMIFNWRIVQAIMAISVLLAILKEW